MATPIRQLKAALGEGARGGMMIISTPTKGNDMTLRRTLAALLVGGALTLTGAPSADASLSRLCTNTKLTNAHKVCITTARHYRTGPKAWPVINRWDGKCHVSYWLTGSKVGPTKGEAFRATCWKKGRYHTYPL